MEKSLVGDTAKGNYGQRDGVRQVRLRMPLGKYSKPLARAETNGLLFVPKLFSSRVSILISFGSS